MDLHYIDHRRHQYNYSGYIVSFLAESSKQKTYISTQTCTVTALCFLSPQANKCVADPPSLFVLVFGLYQLCVNFFCGHLKT